MWMYGKKLPQYYKEISLQLKFLKKERKRLTDLENELMVAGGGEGIVRKFGKVMYTLLYSKWVTNKDLLYSAWNSSQCWAAPGWEQGLGESAYVCMYGWAPLFTRNYHNIVNWLYANTR